MNRRARLSFSLASSGLLVLVAACGDTMEADADMNQDLDRVSEHAALVDGELDTHASAIASSSDLGAIETAETAHQNAMTPHMGELDHMLADMTTYCRHRSTREFGRTHDMLAAVKATRDEMERHRLAPRPDLLAARAEEEKHVRAARAILRAMRDTGMAMRQDAGFYRCEHGNH